MSRTKTSPPNRNASRSNTSPGERYRLRAAGRIVSNREGAIQQSLRTRGERNMHGAARSRRDTRKASIGLAKIGTCNDAGDIQRRGAIIDQDDGLCGTYRTDRLARKC